MASARIIFIVAFAIGWPALASAAINYSSIGSTYSQTFDSLAATGTGHAWVNDPPASPLSGWNLFRVPSPSAVTPAAAIDFYDAGDGTSSSARFYSFGGDTERALGAIGSGNLGDFIGAGFQSLTTGAIIGWIAANITNNTGSELSQFTIGFNGEQWRDAGNDPALSQTMLFQYGFGSSFDAVSSWSAPSGTFDWASPVATTSEAAVDGNSAGRVANRGGTVTGQTWADGTTLWLRWVERNDSGLDHGLAIDDFSFSATASAVPERSTFLFGCVLSCILGAGLYLRRLFRTSAGSPP